MGNNDHDSNKQVRLQNGDFKNRRTQEDAKTKTRTEDVMTNGTNKDNDNNEQHETNSSRSDSSFDDDDSYSSSSFSGNSFSSSSSNDDDNDDNNRESRSSNDNSSPPSSPPPRDILLLPKQQHRSDSQHWLDLFKLVLMFLLLVAFLVVGTTFVLTHYYKYDILQGYFDTKQQQQKQNQKEKPTKPSSTTIETNDIDVNESNTANANTKTFDEWNHHIGTVIDLSNHVRSNEESIISNDLFVQFERDGVIALRGLLLSEEISNVDVASMGLIKEQTQKRLGKKGTQFHTVKQGVMFTDFLTDEDKELSENDSDVVYPFRQLALQSKVAQVASELLLRQQQQQSYQNNNNSCDVASSSCRATDENEHSKGASSPTVRVTRDIFLAKDNDPYVCGWHVDDYGFWPTQATNLGINAWIALDDMPFERGGGFALAVRSHLYDDPSSNWIMEAHKAIGSPLTFPPEGFQTVQDMFDRRLGGGTCNIQRIAPHLHERLESQKVTYNLQKGDVIFATRWLFHRTIPFDTSSDKRNVLRRYSIRYSLGNAQLHSGYTTELCMLHDPHVANQTLDNVSTEEHPWFPQVFLKDEPLGLQPQSEFLKTIRPNAQRLLKQTQKEMKPFLAKLSNQNIEQKRSTILQSMK